MDIDIREMPLKLGERFIQPHYNFIQGNLPNFLQPYDSDYEQKKVIWDKTQFSAKSGDNLKEERRNFLRS